MFIIGDVFFHLWKHVGQIQFIFVQVVQLQLRLKERQNKNGLLSLISCTVEAEADVKK